MTVPAMMKAGAFAAGSLVVMGAAGAAETQVQARPDRLGDALQYVVPASAAALALYEHDFTGLKELGYSLALSQGTTEILKHTVRSRRPDGTGLGFPSGHTSVVFASAGFVQQRYGFAAATPLYALATVTAYSRVHTHHHFTKDVVGGAAVGLGSSWLMTHPFSPSTSASLHLLPDAVSFQLAHTW
jgi:membrane-associated phospholipid phosphatase